MRHVTLSALIFVFLRVPLAEGEPGQPSSATFRDIVSRVAVRDPASGAIVKVKAKADSRRPPGRVLHFAISRVSRGGEMTNEVLVTLYASLKSGKEIYEQYRLMTDGAMLDELRRQQLRSEQEQARQEEQRKQQTERIAALTKGRLRYGMARHEVQLAKGKPDKVIAVAQLEGTETWVYDDMTLRFSAGSLTDIQIAGAKKEPHNKGN